MLNFNEDLIFLDTNETLPLFELYGAGITHADPTYRIPRPQGVPFYTIEYVRFGEGSIHFNDYSLDVGANDSYVLPPNTPVTYHSNPKMPWEKIWINMGGRLPEQLFQAYQLDRVLYKGFSVEGELEECIEAIRQTPTSVPQIALAFHKIVSRLASYQELHYNSRPGELAQKIRNYLEHHWNEPVRLMDLAHLIHRSQVQTLRIFMQAYHCTPEQWLQNRRFTIARQYIANTNKTIRMIAEIIGFKDEFYFSNWFKRKSGMAPGKYRQLGGTDLPW